MFMRTRSRSRSRPRQRLKKSNALVGRLRSRSRPRATPKSKLVVQSYNTKTAKKFKDDDEDENEEEQEETSEEENEPLRGQQKVRNPLTGRMIIVSKKPTSTYQLTLLNPAARDILLHDKLAESKDIQMHQVHHIGTRGRSRSKMIVKKKKIKKKRRAIQTINFQMPTWNYKSTTNLSVNFHPLVFVHDQSKEVGVKRHALWIVQNFHPDAYSPHPLNIRFVIQKVN